MGQFSLTGRRIWVAGGGMLGSALGRGVCNTGCELITCERDALDLRDQAATRSSTRSCSALLP